MFTFVSVFLSSLFLCSTVFAAAASSVSLSTLSGALNERMKVMKDVAGYKAEYQLPVEDPLREQYVIQDALEDAAEAGLDPRTVEPFVRALMNAGKAIQYRYLAGWMAEPDFSQPYPSLQVSRQHIEHLDHQIMTAVSWHLMTGVFSPEDNAWLAAGIHAPGLSDADIHNVLSALALIRRAQ